MILMNREGAERHVLSCYDIEFRRNHKNVLVILFSHSPHHHFKSIKFSADVLSIADTADTYFTRDAGILSAHLLNLMSDYDQIIAIGGSKGGHGAVYHAMLLARATEKPVRVLAFSPVVVLHDNRNELPYTSYQRLMEEAQASEQLAADLRVATEVVTSEPPRNLAVFCILGSGNRFDCVEVLRIQGAHIFTLPMRHHESIIPFLCDTSDPKAVTRTVLVLHDKAAEQADVAHLLEEGAVDAMIADLSGVPKQPGLDHLADLIMTGNAGEIWLTSRPWQ